MNNTNPKYGAGSKPKARLQYFGSVRGTTDRKEEEVEISSANTLYELLQRLSGIYGEAFEKEVFQEDEKDLREDFMVAINGVITERAKVKETVIKPDDIISLFPIFLGGG